MASETVPGGRVLRPVFLRHPQRLVAAAAILVLGGIAILSESNTTKATSNDPVLAKATPESVRAAYRAKVTFVLADPSEMSMVAKGLAASLGGSMVEDDA